MSFLWTTVSVLLIIELVILLMLCLPLPWGVRKNISRWIYRVRAQDKLNASIRYLIFGLCLAFAEAFNSLRTVHIRREFQSADDVPTDPSVQVLALQDFRWQKARAERNLYLSAFSITAWIVILRLIRLASIEIQLRNKIKQYNGNKPLTETGETVETSAKND